MSPFRSIGMDSTDAFLTTSEVAAQLDLTEAQVRALCTAGVFDGAQQAYKRGPWQIPRAAVEAYRESNSAEVPSSIPFFEQPMVKTASKVFAALVVAVTLIAGIFGFLADSGMRDRVYQWFAPAPFEPEQEDEALIVIATFYRTEGIADVAIHDEISRDIQKQMEELNIEKVRIEIEPVQIESDDLEKAREIGEKYNATLIIWGADTGTRIQVNFLNIKKVDQPQLDAISIQETVKTQIGHPQEYNRFVIDELPAQLTYLSFFSLGQVAFLEENYEESARFFNRVLELSLKGTSIQAEERLRVEEATLYLGNSYFFLQQLDEAIKTYDSLIQLNPTSPIAYHNRGSALIELEEYSKALEYFSKAFDLNPSEAPPLNGRGIIFLVQGQYDLAINEFTQAIELDSNFIAAYSNRGLTYAKLGQNEKAMRDYEKALLLNPNDATLLNNRGSLNDDSENFEAALRDYSKAISLNPNYPTYYYNRANTYRSIKEYSRAIDNYTLAISLSSDSDFLSATYHNRGLANADIEKYEEAIEDLTISINLNSTDGATYYDRGVVHLVLENYEAAVLDFGKAWELDVNSQDALKNRGIAFFLLGNYDAALSDWEVAIDIDPQFREELEPLIEKAKEALSTANSE